MTNDRERHPSRFLGGLLVAVGALFVATGGSCAAGMLYVAVLSTGSEMTVTTPDGVTKTMPSGAASLYGLYSGLMMAAIGAAIAYGGFVAFRHGLQRFRDKP